MSTPLNLQLLRLSTLLQLEQRARQAGAAELRFLMVNDTATVVPYQQAALWQEQDGGDGMPMDGFPVTVIASTVTVNGTPTVKTVTVSKTATPTRPTDATVATTTAGFAGIRIPSGAPGTSGPAGPAVAVQ